MTHTPDQSEQELRNRAEERVRQEEVGAHAAPTLEAAQGLLHELRVHQVELEMQNEELRRTQHELESSRARYFDLYNLAPVGYLTLDDQGGIAEANLTSANLLGLARSALVNRRLSSFIFSADQDLYYLHHKQLMETGASQTCDLRMVRADGSLFWAHLQGTVAQEQEGVPCCRLVVSDFTSQKQAEIEARTAKERWEKTFDAIDDVVTIHDQGMRIIQANKAAGSLFQVAADELIGKHCYEVFHGADQPCPGCPELLAHLTLTHQQANIYHAHLGRTFASSSFPLLDETAGLAGFVYVAKDVTESLQMESRLRQTQKMETIGTLAGGIAHDFNNILVPILGYAELAESRVPPGDPLSFDLQQIIKAALRAKDMISQIISYSRQTSQEKRAFHPHLVLKEALKLLKASLPATIEIKTDIAGDCGALLADPTLFHQVVMNLCTNAYQAMLLSGGVLRVSLTGEEVGEAEAKALGAEFVPGDYIVLEVSDTGSGMDSKILERIFDPYFTTKPLGAGAGLGLSVVYGIVKNCRGQITVSSEPGKGTSFKVYLPKAAERPSAVRAGEDLPLPGGTERIAVVDDEVVITGMLKAVLTGLGYQVIAFNNSREALTFITENPAAVDLLITDMTMPQLTGLELSEMVLAGRPGLPIILCTGFNEQVSKEQAQALGIRGFMMKPVTVRDLAVEIRAALDEKGKAA